MLQKLQFFSLIKLLFNTCNWIQLFDVYLRKIYDFNDLKYIFSERFDLCQVLYYLYFDAKSIKVYLKKIALTILYFEVECMQGFI